MHPLLETLQRRNRLVAIIETLSDLDHVRRAMLHAHAGDFTEAEVRVYYAVAGSSVNAFGMRRYRPAFRNFLSVFQHVRNLALAMGATEARTTCPPYAKSGAENTPLRPYRTRDYITLKIKNVETP